MGRVFSVFVIHNMYGSVGPSLLIFFIETTDSKIWSSFLAGGSYTMLFQKLLVCVLPRESQVADYQQIMPYLLNKMLPAKSTQYILSLKAYKKLYNGSTPYFGSINKRGTCMYM